MQTNINNQPPSMDDCLKRDKNITRLMVGIHLFVGLLLLPLIIIGITGMPLVSLLIGIVTWTLVLFWTPVFDWTFVNVGPNYAVIVGKQTVYDKILENPIERTRMMTLASMREIGPGLRGKFPWEIQYDSVNLQSEMVIGPGTNGTPLKCYTSNDIELSIRWQVVLTPLRGCLVNFVGKDEDATVAFFRATFEQAIIKWVKGKEEKEVSLSLDEESLGKAFKDTLGGKDNIHPDEIKWGLFTNDPQILSVERNDRWQKAAEGVQVGTKLAKVIAAINSKFKDQENKPDQNMVLAVATSMIGGKMDGLLLIPGLGKSDSGPLMAAVAKIIGEQKK